MFRPSGTPQYNPKFPKKIFIKIDRIRIRDNKILIRSDNSDKIKNQQYDEPLIKPRLWCDIPACTSNGFAQPILS